MASHCSLNSPKQFLFLKSFGSKIKRTKGDPPKLLKLNRKELIGDFLYSKNSVSLQLLFANYTSSRSAYLRALSSMSSSSSSEEETDDDISPTTEIAEKDEMEFNRVNCLVWVLHESAASFSKSVQSLELAGSNAQLAMAWNGKDIHEWHRNIAYKVAVYTLLKMAIEVEILLSLDRHNNASPVNDILTPNVNLLGEHIESQLKMQHVELVQWFRVVELPRIAGFFIPLLKKWSMEYAGSGVAGIIVAISCCTAVGKLNPARISCPLCTLSIDDVLVELMDLSHSLVEVNKLHQLATEAGFELDFLSHFGGKVLPCNEIEELEFWIGLAQQKLSAAFLKESVAVKTENSLQKADSLATLGLFAYLGRKTRLFLSRMGVKDLEELVKDFLNYMECGILFTYPELASVSAYESFMEVVTDEIGWLDFYHAYFSMSNQERKRSMRQAEKDIILSTVFTVCYDVFSGFAHFIRSAQQPLKAESLEYLLRSQSLLTVCLEDYQAVYARTGESHKIAEAGVSDHIMGMGIKGTSKYSVALEAQQKQRVEHEEVQLEKAGSANMTNVITFMEAHSTSTISSFMHTSLIRRYRVKLASTSSDVWMGTQLLFEDIMNALELLLKQLKGHNVSRRERGKLKRTLNDIASLIPITILMLIPVSAVGHAAMLAGIKRYLPQMIPSPYSSERLDVVKQLNRTKKMEVRSWSNLEDPLSRINFNDSDPSSRINFSDQDASARINFSDQDSRINFNDQDASSRINFNNQSSNPVVQ